MIRNHLTFSTLLKTKIDKKFGKSIKTHKDIELLQVFILQDTGVHLGFNTLRRFLGKLKGTKPNAKTLNAISQYLGYENHIALDKYRLKDEDWKAWRDVNKMQSLPRIDQRNINRLMDLKLNNKDYYLFLSTVMKSAIHQRNVEKMNDVLSADKLFDLEYQLILRVSILVSFQFRVLCEEEYLQWSSLARHQSFRSHFAYQFVDYSHLNGYYGFLLEKCEYYETQPDEILFLKLMNSYRRFLLGGKLEVVIQEKISMDIHPTLLGRYYGHRLLTCSDYELDEIFNMTLSSAKNSTSIMSFFLEIFPQLFLLKRLDYVSKIIRYFYERLFDASEWHHSTEEGIYLLGKSLVDISESNFKAAKASLSLFNISKTSESHQDYYNLFFLLAQYHFEKLNPQPDTVRMIEIEIEYDEIVTRTGLVSFGGSFMKDYFIDVVR